MATRQQQAPTQQHEENGLLDQVADNTINRIREGAALDPQVWPNERVKTVWKVCAPKEASVPDVVMLLSIADRYGLDPLAKEIWLAKDERGKIIILTGRDAFLKIARRDPRYMGYRSGIVHANDTFQMRQDTAAGTFEVVHEINGFPRGEMIGAYCIVYLKDEPPIWIVREIGDYKHLFGKSNWQNYKPDMFDTRVITAAHRRAFNLTALYTPEEFVDGGRVLDDIIDQDAAASERTAVATRDKLATLKDRMNTTAGDAARLQAPPAPALADEATPVPSPAEPVPQGGASPAPKKATREKTTWQRAHDGFFAAIKEYCPEWGDTERKLWSEQHNFPTSTNDWTEFQFKEAVQMLKRGETEIEWPRPQYEQQPEPIGSRSPFDDDDGLPV